MDTRPGPAEPDLRSGAAELVTVARMAASLHNAQPWAFRVERDHVEVRLDRDRLLPVADPTGRQARLGLGRRLGGGPADRLGDAGHVQQRVRRRRVERRGERQDGRRVDRHRVQRQPVPVGVGEGVLQGGVAAVGAVDADDHPAAGSGPAADDHGRAPRVRGEVPGGGAEQERGEPAVAA